MRRSSRKPRLNQEPSRCLRSEFERLQRRLVAEPRQHLAPRRHQRGGAARGHVHPPQQLLPRRFGGVGEAGGVLRRRLREPGLRRRAQPRRVRPEIVGEEAEQLRPPGRVQLARREEQFARHRRARRLAAFGQQRLGQPLGAFQRRQLRHRGRGLHRRRRPVRPRSGPPGAAAAETGPLQDRTPEAIHPGLRPARRRRRFGLRCRRFHVPRRVPVQTVHAGAYYAARRPPPAGPFAGCAQRHQTGKREWTKPPADAPTGPLRGLRVLDLTRVLAGPTCTQMLGDLGAEIIKIERPGAGDDTRGFAPPFWPNTEESAYFLGANRNKKSVTLDIAKPEGQAICHRLLESCDILAENFKVGALAKYGLGWEQLGPKYPRLIYCSITGFGQDGPYAPRPGYDALVQAMGGVMSLTGEPDGHAAEGGHPGRRPLRRPLRLHRRAGGAEPPQRDRPGPADRHRHAGHARGLAGQPGHELPGHRREPAAARQPAPEHRALPGIPDRRTATSSWRSATTRPSSASARTSGRSTCSPTSASPPTPSGWRTGSSSPRR